MLVSTDYVTKWVETKNSLRDTKEVVIKFPFWVIFAIWFTSGSDKKWRREICKTQNYSHSKE